jgi:formamidopyrimidine-DNA glycosylase
MPELPEVESARRQLAPAMERARFVDVALGRPDLRTAFPPDFRSRLLRQTVTALTRRAKYLLATLSSQETLVMHLGMSGSFRLAGDNAERSLHDHVVFRMSSGATVIFNDPRRFGFMDIIEAGALGVHPVLSLLGPEPLSPAFDGFALAHACRGRKTSLKAALLDQRVVAGLGNIYASEALHVARLSPLRQASTVATPSGLPRPSAHELARAIKVVLTEAIDRASGRRYRGSRFRVYDREMEPCRRKGCTGSIRRRTQGGRSTFFCPRCQR